MKRITVSLTTAEYLKTVQALERLRDELADAGYGHEAAGVDALRCKLGEAAQGA